MGFYEEIKKNVQKEVTRYKKGVSDGDCSGILVTSPDTLLPLPEGQEVEKVVRSCGQWCVEACGRPIGKPDYERLIDSGIDDLEVECLAGAMFLFAVGKVRGCAQYEFDAMCRRYVPYWRKRLDKAAWGIVGGMIKEKLKGT